MADRKISQFTDGGLVQTDDEIAAVRGGQNYKVTVGSAAALDAGVNVGDVVALIDIEGVAGLPAVDGSQLVNLPVTPSGLVLVDNDDPTPDYLTTKIVAGDNVMINTITYSDGSKALEIEASGGGGTGTVLLSDIETIPDGRIVSNISGTSSSPLANNIEDVLAHVGIEFGDEAGEIPVLDSDAQIPLSAARRKIIGPSSVAGVVEVQLTGIPAWAKRITVACGAVSPANNSPCVLRVMVGGASVNAGYDGMTSTVAATNLVTSGSNSGYFLLSPASPVANALSMSGSVNLVKVDTNLWSVSGVMKARTDSPNATSNSVVAGIIVTSAAIDGIIVRGGGTNMVSGLVTVIVEG